jgi:excinuclease UvrABC ATPase subunit
VPVVVKSRAAQLPVSFEGMTEEFIEVRGARENNLKDVSLDIPKRKITVFTGVSGSGKSSLVFDTIAAEAQHQLKQGSAYVMDEPTTGLHLSDVGRLMGIVDRLVDSGNTVILIEHHLDAIRHADWIIDLGPEGGSAGGDVLYEGPPAGLKRCARSITARFI